MRPPSSVAIATLKPSPTSPSTCSGPDACTFSKKIVHECAAWMPSFSSCGASVKPGVSSANEERGVLRLVAARASVTANTMMWSACGPDGDEVLRAVEDVAAVALLSATVDHRLRVGAAHRLGEPEAAELLARRPRA